MMKHKKAPTPQELYWMRKQQEEDEKSAYLPPGLINHGNDCFMNSTLQGLMATQLLYDLVNFRQLPAELQNLPSTNIAPRRSPQLTNGHGRGGQYEREREQGMPLGDIFIGLMSKAWDFQQNHKRGPLNAKELLTTIGQKYDQYLDFCQQDAHEFLRHMLDAMRMEEQDIIKKRQPPKNKKRGPLRKATSESARQAPATSGTNSLWHASSSRSAEEEPLESFVDMLFGGKLASVLVCEKCKKVSITYEDFNDLSLSIKAEDYVKERKRDRLKMLAKKFRFRQSDRESDSGKMPRSSSVPASPVRRSMDTAPHDEEPPQNEDPRRRSFDHAGGQGQSGEEVARAAVQGIAIAANVDLKSLPATIEDEDRNEEGSEEKDPKGSGNIVQVQPEIKVEIVIDKVNGEHKKEKEDSLWKLGRRLSTSMKMVKKEKRLSRSRDLAFTGTGIPEEASSSTPNLAVRPTGAIDSGSDAGDVSDTARSPAMSPPVSSSPLATPPITKGMPFFPTGNSISPLIDKRSKSPRPPKPSPEQSAYLRRILADVHPNTPSALSMLQQALSSSSSSSSASVTTQAILSKMGHLPDVEECLRMFTAVEILDGENMVGCHRCWKIANGTYKLRGMPNCPEEEAVDESEQSPSGSPVKDGSELPNGVADISDPSRPPNVALSPSVSVATESAASSLFHRSVMSASSVPTSAELHEKFIRAPADDVPHRDPPPTSPAAYGGIPIPSISTTAPDSPQRPPFPPNSHDDSSDAPHLVSPLGVSPSNDSLLPPRIRRRRRANPSKSENDLDESSESTDGSDNDGSGSDASASASVYSDASSVASLAISPPASPRTSTERLPLPVPPPKRPQPSTSSKVPRSQQVIMRRTYKRYLIASPPPVLVVHLKRFQQISKTHAMSFSGGFKKLDDYVAFPEFLDLTPFLAPKKEDFGLGKSKSVNGRAKDDRCMYRLYAVVVHIGNMLGGHYIAYTALPSERSAGEPPDQPSPAPAPAPEKRERSSAEQIKQRRLWAYISDATVKLTTLEEVLKAKAYICMYERVS